MERNGIKHICSAPYHPSTNGLVERAVQTFNQSLQQIQGTSIKEKLNKFFFKYCILSQELPQQNYSWEDVSILA